MKGNERGKGLTEFRRSIGRIEADIRAELFVQTGKIKQLELEENVGKPFQVLGRIIPFEPSHLQTSEYVNKTAHIKLHDQSPSQKENNKRALQNYTGYTEFL